MSFALAHMAPLAAIARFLFLSSDPQSSEVTSAPLIPFFMPSTDLSTFFALRGVVGFRLDRFGGRGRRAADIVEGISKGPNALRRASV